MLEDKEKEILNLFISMAGREDENILEKLTPEVIKPLKDAVSELSMVIRGREAWKVINRILSLLGIKRISTRFFETVFKEVNFSRIDEIRRSIEKFQWLCLLEYADIFYGYDVFSEGDDILVNAWTRNFSPQERPSRLSPNIERIEPHFLFTLGYLAYDQFPHVSEARAKLGNLLDELLREGKTKSAADLKELAEEKFGMRYEQLQDLCAKAAIPEGGLLLNFPLGKWLFPYTGTPYKTYFEVLRAARENCEKPDNKVIEECRFKGFENTRIYLSAPIDVYIATSMRETTDFLTNHAFVSSLMEDESLRHLNLTFFDPTQAYIPERVHKGVLECLMVRQAQVTIYNAQETETFGKDAEAAISLAHGKPVIIYVPRIFAEEMAREEVPEEKKGVLEDLKKMYSDIDELSLRERADFLEGLKEKNYLSGDEVVFLSSPDKDKRHTIEYVIDKHSPRLLQQFEGSEIRSALFNKGYQKLPLEKKALVEYCRDKIKKLEVRALLFRDIHPLTFQISPVDTVARGVFITRSIQETARLLRALFEGTLEYEIRTVVKKVNGQELKTLLLCDKITNSPVRACPKDYMMRNRLLELRSIYSMQK